MSCQDCRWKNAEKCVAQYDWPCWECSTATNSNWRRKALMTRKRLMVIIGWFTLLTLLLIVSGNRGDAEAVVERLMIEIVDDDGAVVESLDHGFNGAGIVEGLDRRTYRPPIVDIRAEPGVNLMGGGLGPLAADILGFRGYDAGFKFENQMWTAQNRSENVWRPY